jgi:hypothetical protein
MDLSWVPDWARNTFVLPDWARNNSWMPDWIRDPSWMADWHSDGQEFLASHWPYLLGFLMIIIIGMYFFFREIENPLEGSAEEMGKVLEYFKPGTKGVKFDSVKIRLIREVPCLEGQEKTQTEGEKDK